MIKILADYQLPHLSRAFPPPFELSFYQNAHEIPALLADKHVLLCRSTLKVNASLLKDAPCLSYVCTASSGSDHIDSTYLQKKNISLFDAKGCNAYAVADYVMASLAYLQKNKILSELKNKTVGIVGLGAVGSQIAEYLQAFDLEIFFHDPLKKIQQPDFKHSELNALLACDILCIHSNLHHQAPYPSANLINADFLRQLKKEAVLINAARGGIVDEDAVLSQSLLYCTDVYQAEPEISKKIVNHAVLCTPHIAGHSLEAKFNAIAMVSTKLHQAFQLQAPLAIKMPNSKDYLNFFQKEGWQDALLALYNPESESIALKKAKNLSESFLALRKAHQKRHDLWTLN